MADTLDPAAPAPAPNAAAPETPDAPLTPQDVTADLISRGLAPEQRAAFQKNRASRKAKAPKAASAAAPAGGAPAPQPDTEPGSTKSAKSPAAPDAEPAPAAETVMMGDEPAPAPPPAEEEPDALTEEELAKLDEKARKRVAEASKEAAKVRKRAQEAEAKVKELESQITAAQEKIKTAETEAAAGAQRAAGLAGNVFARFTDSQQVAAWGVNAQDALVLLGAHEREVKAGRAEADEPVRHTLPDGQEVEIRGADRGAYEQRAADAQAWFDHEQKAATHRASAVKLAEKHQGTKGYAEALAAYRQDKSLAARLDELAAKAAWYDLLTSRRAEITFRDTAGAAKSAPATRAEASPAAQRKQPPVETPASTPRLSRTDDDGSDLKARKSALMQRAMNAKTEDERQKLLKEAIKLGSTATRRSAA